MNDQQFSADYAVGLALGLSKAVRMIIAESETPRALSDRIVATLEAERNYGLQHPLPDDVLKGLEAAAQIFRL
ncbi:hypothetical protein [Crenobacter cavernae]|uniref:Uncharacterized protein n=1 Tax=Crenobacter cavernae TaxID=2290923 RepID=A0ABY0FED1_9NEIS|nr:hypothetical protein [Crenobacter cavernae]RXZ42714.1 hypothetical protein EBB06_12540 [Crenobacter cavernae]